MNTWRLSANNTHLYPGAHIRGLDESMREYMRNGDRVLLEFADQVIVAAEVCNALPQGWTLAVDAHTTAKGTAIEPKRWQVRWLPRDQRPGTMKIQARAS
ncbi:hypothetical protein [Variovorax saccharolyticus]|uniref:hypothetical protein n=1 Tax=Variovorax saccharolyticus TaxID=3053516 RepID=UPI00257510A6|nr:hypothetical protein [Variovorax sp. J31P216]MDM0029537.1 hypothetical protein [Variovorax sp. J31P216]